MPLPADQACQEWLAERLSQGQQPLSDGLLRRMTSETLEPSVVSAMHPTSVQGQRLSASAEAQASSNSCPFEHLGRDAPLVSIVRSEDHADCQICFEVGQLPLICDSCDPGKRACSQCLRTYFTTAVEDALYAMPMIKCPLCRGRIGTAAWAPFVERRTREKYLGNGVALLSLRCPVCDETTTFCPQGDSPDDAAGIAGAGGELSAARRRASNMRGQLQREELWCDLLASRAAAARRKGGLAAEDPAACDSRTRAAGMALADAWTRFRSAEASADEFVARLHCAWPPSRGEQLPRSLRCAARHRLPVCIEDPERRTAMQLAWLRRYPKVKTPCCKARVCFKCKVRGWHRGLTCEERMRRETQHDAQMCPSCGVPTTRSDGCNQIRCVCGADWTWKSNGVDVLDDQDAASEGSVLDSEADAEDPIRNRNAIELAAMNLGSKADAGSASAKALAHMLASQSVPQQPPGRSAVTSNPSTRSWLGDETEVTCLKGHSLDFIEQSRTGSLVLGGGFWVCDVCNDMTENALPRSSLRRWRCDLCNYDVCRHCYQRQLLQKRKPSSSEAAEESLEPSSPAAVAVEAAADVVDGTAAGAAGESGGAAAAASSSASLSSPASRELLERRPDHYTPTEQTRVDMVRGDGSRHYAALQFAVRARNPMSVRVLLNSGTVLSEAALEELWRIPDEAERKLLEVELWPALRAVRPSSLPLWARIHFGVDCEERSSRWTRTSTPRPSRR